MTETVGAGVRSTRRRPGGPRRWTASDKSHYLDAFARRGVSIAAFCAEQDVPRATFTLWQREARQHPSRFARVELVSSSGDGIRMLVRGAGGIDVEFTGLDGATSSALLQVVIGRRAR